MEGASCTNEELLRAIRHLSTFREGTGQRRRVNYANLDVEEFGSVYESLLDFHPQVSLDPPAFDLVVGGERKQTGSYYTPPDLVRELINSALVPVMEERLSGAKDKEDKEKALLGLRVCDPAAGSGHFLLAAARRIARELAHVRSGEDEPSPGEYREALRDVIRNCIYAVDKNPLAVDLCKVALWIEGHNAGLPLSFLDNHIKCGDSLVGVADLAVLSEGIPDDAYKPVTGDDKSAAKEYRKRNQEEKKKEQQLSLGGPAEHEGVPATLAEDFETLGLLAERTPDEVQAKEDLYESLRGRATDWWKMKVACDLWTAAFFMPLQPEDALNLERVPTTGTIRRHLESNSAHPTLIGQAVEIAHKHAFFHWPLEFPDIFEQDGFDVVLGNPPWDQLQFREQEFFTSTRSDIARASNVAARKRMIEILKKEDSELFNSYGAARYEVDAARRFMQYSSRFPLTAHGRINLYGLFAETSRNLTNRSGRVGCIIPTGIATDDSAKLFFQDLMRSNSLISLYDFENREQLFSDVD
ncbi:MAG: N-6 DNA methylase, partial [Candidatus Marinimicrobia bacterium]|nr:N-6 DNA methylase [Candidatus Neomarinimicrobiota bacterium]